MKRAHVLAARVSSFAVLASFASLASFACGGEGTSIVSPAGSSGASGATVAPGSPAAPSNLTAEPMDTGIHLIWKDNASNEDVTEVERKDGDAAFAKIYAVPFDTFSYHDASLVAGKVYAYRVRAVNAAGPSAYSNEVTATAPSGATPDAGAPVDAGPRDASVANPTFQRDIVPLVQASCGAGNSSCHIRDMYAATKTENCRGWLSLEDAMLGSQIYGGASAGQATGCPDRSLYDRLTQLDAWQTPNGQLRRYVKPRDPANSYLYNKLTGGPYGEKSPGVQSDPMPLSAALAPDDIQMVKRWIEQGAAR